MTTQQERLSIALLFLFILTPRQQWCVASPVRQMIQEQDEERRLQHRTNKKR